MKGKTIKLRIIVGVVAIVLAIVIAFVVLLYAHNLLSKVGSSVGFGLGKVVGSATGSFEGITQGVAKGKEDGRIDGMNQNEISLDIQSSISSIGKLEVLAADVSLTIDSSLGNTYRELSIISGDAVFTLDLSKVDVKLSQDATRITITLPEPEMQLFLDQKSMTTLASIQKIDLSVSTEDIINSKINAMAKSVTEARNSIANYDSLLKIAKDSAELQIRQLMSITNKQYSTSQIEFKYE